MEFTLKNQSASSAILSVNIQEADYSALVEKQLKNFRQKANVPGFRPGMVPLGVVRKMYGKGVVAEQSYKLASNSVFEYLQKEGIDYVGDVIPSEEQGDFDFENNTEHEFMFEIGEAPKVEVELSAKDKLTYNTIKVDKKMLTAYKDNYLRRFGRLVEVDEVKKMILAEDLKADVLVGHAMKLVRENAKIGKAKKATAKKAAKAETEEAPAEEKKPARKPRAKKATTESAE